MESKPASIEDIISYTPETYFSEDELTLLRAHFNGPEGAKLLRIIRKVMLPTVSDPALPIEELGKDIFLGGIDIKQLPEGEVKPTLLGLQYMVKAVMGGLIQLRNMANVKEESPENRAQRREKNSSR